MVLGYIHPVCDLSEFGPYLMVAAFQACGHEFYALLTTLASGAPVYIWRFL